jgi:uncharacterized NAD(P)/FAD-binding protein YdhS
LLIVVSKKQAVFLQSHRFVDVAIVGAGFSGSMVAIHLADTFQASREIALIEKRPRFGPGIAYGTDYRLHLLNVPAGKMGAYPEKPRHFLEWLKERRDLVSQYRLDPLNTTICARKVVLAVGNFPPGDPITSDRRFHLSRKYLSDPWSSSTLRRLAYAGDILILGSGLTALDLIVSLSQIKQSGKNLFAVAPRTLPPPTRTRRTLCLPPV